MGGEKGRDEDERVKVQEDANGIGDLIRSFVGRQDKEAEKERQEGPLTDASQPPPWKGGGLPLTFSLRNWSGPP